MFGTKTKYARKRHKRNETTAARADKRKRQPGRRNRATDDRKIYRALNRDDCGDSRRKVTFESGFCVYRDFYARIYENDEDYCKNRYSEKPRFFPDDRQYEVAFRKRQEQIFLSAVEISEPEKSAAAQRIVTLYELVSFAFRVFPRIQKRQKSFHSIRLGNDKRGDCKNRGRKHRRKLFRFKPADVQHNEHYRPQTHRN